MSSINTPKHSGLYNITSSISTTLHVMNKMLEIKLYYNCYNIIQKLKNYSSLETHRVASDFFPDLGAVEALVYLH